MLNLYCVKVINLVICLFIDIGRGKVVSVLNHYLPKQKLIS
jgi:hypothetical protein